MSKLTAQQKKEIIERYNQHLNSTPQKLTEEYNIPLVTFWRIVSPKNRTATNIRNMIYATERRIKLGVCRDVKKAEQRIKDLRKQLSELVNQ